MIEGIKAVAFDIDGTMYAEWELYSRIAGYVLHHLKFYITYSKIRKILHKTAPLADFYEYQARLFANELGISTIEAKTLINDVCYEGLKPYFKKVPPYPYLVETIKKFKEAGLKIGIMSDFPPEQKEELWGIRALCDVCIGSEESGALKPSKYPFGILAQKLDLNPSEILYVGNSLKYDVRGAHNAGMRTAYILKGWRKVFNVPHKEADISFSNYKQLYNLVLL